MELEIRAFTKDRIPDVLDFESRLRKEEDFWGWEINQAYVSAVERSFDDRSFRDCVSLLAYDGGTVVGRIDASLIASHFDGSKKAYLDWICVIKSSRHQGVAQRLLESLRQILKERQIDTLIALTAANEEAQRFYKSVPDSVMKDIGIWIDIK
ncbi:MAG: GNAT family N-acetyltransferase [Lachnospiraceae bacterium]|jgi:ribosomal protein S18 acetylase RimI-like enzyme|nr:GNAT family N-acetyltransferase [uncultured Acetatifactor sp.]MCI9231042.1 GNAT family N-acetyltransferase [Lachnospiraceae bacterium]MCI9572384.1 GNAT family N-acetyltransferase [Lachnospiraceae bacterium]